MGFYLKKSEIILDTNINKYVIPNYINTKTYERLYLKNPSTDKFVYLSQDPYHNGIGRFVRNPSCWINGVTNISCFSPAQLSGAAWNTRAGTLLTRKHVLFAKHYVPAIITGGTPPLKDMGLIADDITYFRFPDQINDCAEWLGLPTPVPLENAEPEEKKPVLTPEQELAVRLAYADDITLWESLQ